MRAAFTWLPQARINTYVQAPAGAASLIRSTVDGGFAPGGQARNIARDFL